MVQWESPGVVALCMFVFSRLTVLCLGMYLWYFVLSFAKVELALLARRVRFQFSHVPYLTGRYIHLLTLLTIVATTPLHSTALPTVCGSLAPMRIVATTGDIAIAAASCNLALRAMVLWRAHPRVVWALRGACALQLIYGIIFGCASVTRNYDPVHGLCVVGIADGAKGALLAFLLYTVALDLAILALTVVGIRRAGLPRDAPLAAALLRQGVGYGAVTVLTSVPMAVMSYLKLNGAMNVFLFPLGCTITVIASSAAVASLLDIKTPPTTRRTTTEPHRAPQTPRATTKYPLSTIVDLWNADTPSEIVTEEPVLKDAA